MTTPTTLRYTMTALLVASFTLTIGVEQRSLFAAEASALQVEQEVGQPSGDAWIDELLASELGYDAEQIADFKANIADMPEDELRAMVASMKTARATGDESAGVMESSRLSSHRRLISRLENANRRAFSRPAYQTSYAKAPQSIRHPSRQTLFRGYFIRLNY